VLARLATVGLTLEVKFARGRRKFGNLGGERGAENVGRDNRFADFPTDPAREGRVPGARRTA
jgi:hypothetical protein